MPTLKSELVRVFPAHAEKADYVCLDCGRVNTCSVNRCETTPTRAEVSDIEAGFLAHEQTEPEEE